MLDKGEICDELRAIAESVGEWGNKLLEEDVFPREDYRELERAGAYLRAFLKSRLASVAPSSDLKFLSLMKIYAREDKSAVEVCVKSVLNHLWYLSEQLVVFAIFDHDLPSSLKPRLH
ncbi:hypothetical protein OUZ56_032183 [Daphnia magna]|uniref:Uncharacterized protein n=1 Tax=Daphnia magna TaxID=35525 RepID=A0ABQ9ZWE3_9CRUS|nr:hypothetical protein OUZ56_032183 [Daphnia magna]